MSETIRAWKDPQYRASLSAEQRAALATHPSGATWSTLDQDELSALVGGRGAFRAIITNDYTCTWCVPTFGGCPPPA